jgi:hypothetical protein
VLEGDLTARNRCGKMLTYGLLFDRAAPSHEADGGTASGIASCGTTGPPTTKRTEGILTTRNYKESQRMTIG